MKHTIILLALLAVGCNLSQPEKVYAPYNLSEKEHIYYKGILKTVEVESCTYVLYTGLGIVHAGNCPNPIHYSDTCCKHK